MALTPQQIDHARIILEEVFDLLAQDFGSLLNAPAQNMISVSDSYIGMEPEYSVYQNIASTLDEYYPPAYELYEVLNSINIASASQDTLSGLVNLIQQVVDAIGKLDGSVYSSPKNYFSGIPKSWWRYNESGNTLGTIPYGFSQHPYGLYWDPHWTADPDLAFFAFILESLKEYLSFYGVTYFNRRSLPPVPGPVDVSSMMPADSVLEANYPKEGFEAATHYVAVLEKNPLDNSSGLPVRLSPGRYPTPLTKGWDDLNFKYLNNNGKLGSGPARTPHLMRIGVGTRVHVTEVVAGQSGIWVGFIALGSDEGLPVGYAAATNGNQRVLYTRPEFLRRYSDVNSLTLAHTLLPHEEENLKPSVTAGASLIQPDSNLNWAGLEYANVHLAYYSFDKHNIKYPTIRDEEGNVTDNNFYI